MQTTPQSVLKIFHTYAYLRLVCEKSVFNITRGGCEVSNLKG